MSFSFAFNAHLSLLRKENGNKQDARFLERFNTLGKLGSEDEAETEIASGTTTGFDCVPTDAAKG